MMRFLWAGVLVLLSLFSFVPRSTAQDCLIGSGLHLECGGWQPGPADSLGAFRREMGPMLLLGIHPLMTLLPCGGFGQSQAVVPCPVCNRPGQVVTVGQTHTGSLIFGTGVNTDAGLCGSITFVAGDSPGVSTCSHPMCLCPWPPPMMPSVEPPCVLTNLERLLQAERWLKRGEELSRAGHLVEAVDCFQQVHVLVPGSSLDARAGEGTREILVKVYGTSNGSGVGDEACEPGPGVSTAVPASGCAKSGACANSSAKAGDETCPKPRTVVYPVGHLLGRGTETRHDDLEELMNVIAATVEPKSWAENGGEGTMEAYYRCRALVIRQTPAAHEQIAELLDGLREARAQAGSNESQPRRATPSGRTAKASVKKSCCEQCGTAKGCAQPCPEVSGGDCPCEECCPMPVLTLPARMSDNSEALPHLELVIEGCTDESPDAVAHAAFRCTIGGACAEADSSAEGPRWRCQIPLGPCIAVMRYEHHELSVGIRLMNRASAEESESHE